MLDISNHIIAGNRWGKSETNKESFEILKVENIDTINLKKAPITLQFKTIKEGRTLYEADYIKVCDYIEYVINSYQNKKYYLNQFDKDYFASF